MAEPLETSGTLEYRDPDEMARVASFRQHRALASALDTLKHIAKADHGPCCEDAYEALEDINKILKGEA